MKNKQRIFSLFLMVFFLVLGQGLFSQETIVLASGEWPPFIGEKLPSGGYINHLVTEAFASQGFQVSYNYYPWSRTENMVRSGVVLGTAGYAKTEEREAKFIFGDVPVLEEKTVFFYLKGSSFDWETDSDLRRFNIGVNLGDYAYDELLDKGVYVDGSNDYSHNFSKLLRERIDAFLVSEFVGRQYLKELSREDQARIVLHPRAYKTDNYYLMFSRNFTGAAHYLKAGDAGLLQLMESGRKEELYGLLLDGYYR